VISVDASVALKWVLPEEYAAQALFLIDEALSGGQHVVAPPLLPIEVTNTIRQYVRRNDLLQIEAEALLDQFLAFPVTLTLPVDLHRQALQLAADFDLPAVYDAHYVALAQMLGATLWTDDRRLLRALHGTLSFVHWIGDFGG
jgi:predicted nucleic acid-binding protein